MDRLYWTVEQAAKVRGIRYETFKQMVDDGLIPAMEENGTMKVSRRLLNDDFDVECLRQMEERRAAKVGAR